MREPNSTNLLFVTSDDSTGTALVTKVLSRLFTNMAILEQRCRFDILHLDLQIVEQHLDFKLQSQLEIGKRVDFTCRQNNV